MTPVHQDPKNTAEALAAFPGLTPYKILEKSASSFHKVKFLHIDMEAWFENPVFHIKSTFDSDIQDVDNYKTNGRIGASLLIPGGISTSQWVQAYEIRGVPFTWDLEKREWVEKVFKISSKNVDEVLEYSILKSLFSINEGAADPESINFLGLEKRKGQDCFILQYKLDPKVFERWGTIGDISVKVWIDTQEFLPRLLRSEGQIGDAYILQIVDYSNFNAPLELSLPSFITQKVTEKKDGLQAKVDSLTDAVSNIRGWEPLADKVKIEFKNRIAFGDFIRQEVEKDYTELSLKNEGFLFKWLGLLPKDADYKENMINFEVSSIAGLYDPKQKVILVGDWVNPSIAELVFVHEIAHAFQDKYLDLEKFLNRQEVKDNLDFAFAHQSLLEGEATAVMLEYLLKKDRRSFKDLGDIPALIEEKIFKDSQYVRQNITYNVYGYGANFIQAHLKPFAWVELNKFYKTPPSSTKEIIHPYKYTEEAAAVSAPAKQEGKTKLAGGWNRVYETNLGEFLLLLSLRQSLDREVAEKAVEGWKTDKIAIYEKNNNQRLIVFRAEWDTPGDASEFFKAYKEAIKKRYPGTSLQEGKGYVFLKTKGKEIFTCKSENDKIEILWIKGLNLGEFQSLVKAIMPIQNPILK